MPKWLLAALALAVFASPALGADPVMTQPPGMSDAGPVGVQEPRMAFASVTVTAVSVTLPVFVAVIV